MTGYRQVMLENIGSVPEVHIAGVVVHADNQRIQFIRQAISILPARKFTQSVQRENWW